jgi:hypothetical protein
MQSARVSPQIEILRGREGNGTSKTSLGAQVLNALCGGRAGQDAQGQRACLQATLSKRIECSLEIGLLVVGG